MCRFVVVLVLALVGCAEPEGWRPNHAPLQVTLPADASETELAAVLAGVARWREELGEEVITISMSDAPAPSCGRVDVHFEAMRGLANGTTVRAACHASITLQSGMSEAYLGVVAAHELGHALGLDHDQDERSLMYPSAPRDGGHLTFDALEYVSELLR